MKKEYKNPELDITLFEEDILTNSTATGPDEGNVDIDSVDDGEIF